MPQQPIEGDDVVRLQIDRTVYSKEALLQACYWFTDRAYLLLSSSTDTEYTVTIRSKPGQPHASSAIAGELTNALIDAELRQQVTRETGRIRELIFAKAFAEGGLLEDAVPGDDMDPVERKRMDAPAPRVVDRNDA